MAGKVSVLVASFNHAPYLRECLESALSQTHSDLEVLVFDDQSEDDSVATARSLTDPRITVRRNTQKLGAYGTAQAALEASSGDWIAVLNSDDFWASSKLHSQLQLMERVGADWCYTDGQMIDAQSRPLKEDNHGDWPEDERQWLVPQLLESNRILASSLIFRRGAVTFDGSLRYCGDWRAALQLAENGPAAFVREKLTFWRQHETNSYRRSPDLTEEEIGVRTGILKRKREWLERTEPGIRVALSKCAMHLSALLVLRGDMAAARRYSRLAISLKANPASIKRAAAAYLPKGMAKKRLWKPGS